MASNELTNSSKLIFFTIKRDKLWLPCWIIAIVVSAFGFAPVFKELAGTADDMQVLAELMKNPVMIALSGPVYGDEYTIGVMFIQMMLSWIIILIAVMNIFFIIRHTRKDEEDGKTEVIRSLPVGKVANLFSVFVLVLIVNLIISVLSGLGLGLLGIDGMNFSGAMLYGFTLGASGFVFAGIAGICAQIFSSSRGASGASIAVLGFFYLLRAAGDLKNAKISIFSPFGIAGRTNIFVDNNIWPVLLLLLISIVLIVVAFLLNARRDFGAGLLPQRNGREHAKKSLSGPFGLALRLNKGTLIAWAITVFIFAASYGSVFGDLKKFIDGNELFMQLMGMKGGDHSLTDPIVATVMMVMSIIIVIPIVSVVLRLGTEEKKDRLEMVYAKAVSKTKNILSYSIIAFLATIVLQLLNVIGMWSAIYAVMDDPIKFNVILKSGLNYIPAMLVFVGLAVFLLGLLPKLTIVTWIYLALNFIINYLGGMLDIPDWVKNLSVFGLTPRYPEANFEIVPIIMMILVACVLTIIGTIAYRKREI